MITLTEVKTLLQISDNTKDVLIQFNIPIAVELICNYCKNYFLDTDTYIKSSVVFASIDNSLTITSFNSEFIASDYIRTMFTTRNNYYAKINSISSTKLILSDCSVINETPTDEILIFRVAYPSALKIAIAQLINYLISNADPNIKRESIDDYSVEFMNDQVGGIPSSIARQLNLYRKLYWDEINIDDY